MHTLLLLALASTACGGDGPPVSPAPVPTPAPETPAAPPSTPPETKIPAPAETSEGAASTGAKTLGTATNGWRTASDLMPPQCFVVPWLSGDNFERFLNTYSVPSGADLFKNPGLSLGRAIPNLEPIPGFAVGSRLVLSARLDLCMQGSINDGVILADPKEPVVELRDDLIWQNTCSEEDYCSPQYYRVLADITPAHCQQLAPHLKGRCVAAKLVRLTHVVSGSMGDYEYGGVFGLFDGPGEQHHLVPLKIFSQEDDWEAYARSLE